MNRFSCFMGIDISKKWIDLALLDPQTGQVESYQIDNRPLSIKTFVKSLKIDLNGLLFCLENTGAYCNAFKEVAALLNLNTWIEHPLQIKRSIGMRRGKTDQLDAIRIAEYAYRFQDKAVLWSCEPEAIAELKALQAKRSLLVKTQKQLKGALAGKKDKDLLSPLKAIGEAIGVIEEKIRKVITSDEQLDHYGQLLLSVPGVGKVLSTALITATDGFTILTDPRKLSCYMGIAPFPYRSGSSIQYRNRVSNLGNKRLKSLINLSAWNAIRSIPSLKNYYERKVKQGKHKLSVINAVANKLIAIILSVIRRRQPFTKEYSGPMA